MIRISILAAALLVLGTACGDDGRQGPNSVQQCLSESCLLDSDCCDGNACYEEVCVPFCADQSDCADGDICVARDDSSAEQICWYEDVGSGAM